MPSFFAPKLSSRRMFIVVLAVCFLSTAYADVTAPAEVTSLSETPNATVAGDLDLSWTIVTTDVTGNAETVNLYNIYRGDTPDFVPDKSGKSNLIGTSATSSFTDAGALTDGLDHYYLISAEDTAGNEGLTRASTAIVPPILSGFWTETTIELNWTDAAPVDQVAGYRVYYGRKSGVYEFVDDVSLANGHTLGGLDLWVNWFAAVAAVDLNGNESILSTEHIDAVAGRVRVRAHDDSELCWGAAKCPPLPEQVQQSDGWRLMAPIDFPVGDWTSVQLKLTMASKLCQPPAGGNTTRCGSGNPCVNPPCNGGYNTCGDPWDRGAHVFLVLDDCIETGSSCRNSQNLELMRAITPFGTDAPAPDGLGIVPPRELTIDITPYTPLLNGAMYVGAEIGHYVQTGHWVTVEFEFSERDDERSPKPPADGIQVLFYGGANPPAADLTVPVTAQQVFTRLFTTGHGGNQMCDGGTADGESCSTGCPGGSCQNCDEFCHRLNQIMVNGVPAWEHVPWRDDCSPSGNPCPNWNSCGTTSCTFSRAGWCPGYVACHHDAPCDQDLDMTLELPPGGTYSVDYNVTPLNGSWNVSLVAYWYNDSIAVCGNKIREGVEVCDGTDLAGESCQNLGFDAGTLSCAVDCTGYNTSGCRSFVCGDTFCDVAGGEDCINCAADCNGVQGGNPGNRYCCGAGGGETPVPCTDPRCNANGNTCE